MTDHALVRTPAGEVVDGRRLLAEAVSFGRALRAEGLGIDLGAAVDFARALTLVELGEREQVRAAGSAVFVRRRDDREVYDRVFERFWRRRGLGLGGELVDGRLRRDDGVPADDPDASTEAESGDKRGPGHQDLRGTPIPGDDDDETLASDAEGVVVAPDAFSASEVLRHRDFDRMTAAELRDAERLVDLLEPRLERRRTRRYELHHHGRLLAARAMFDAISRPVASWWTGRGDDPFAGRGRWWCCATSLARWSVTRDCCCGSSRRSARRPRCGPNRSCSARGSPASPASCATVTATGR